jgi:hypothetical protein
MLVNCFLLQGSYSTLSNIFILNSLSSIESYPALNILTAIAYIVLLLLAILLVKIKKGEFYPPLLIIINVSLLVVCFYNSSKIYSTFNKVRLQRENNIETNTINPIFSLSKDKPNLIVIMSDCAINGFVKPIFSEHPKLLEQFDGFSLYPNTVSFALHTLMGVPPIWGGYEYTPL